jgi:hypothetical protein
VTSFLLNCVVLYTMTTTLTVFYSFVPPASRTTYPILGKCSWTPESRPRMTSCSVVPINLPCCGKRPGLVL